MIVQELQGEVVVEVEPTGVAGTVLVLSKLLSRALCLFPACPFLHSCESFWTWGVLCEDSAVDSWDVVPLPKVDAPVQELHKISLMSSVWSHLASSAPTEPCNPANALHNDRNSWH